MTLAWPPAVQSGLESWAESCYPYEGCGVLVGEFLPGEMRRVKRFVPLTNQLREKDQARSELLETARETLGKRAETEGHFEFVMDPAAFNSAMVEAGNEGLDVVGILHTHPDHPARPSATDAAQPLLAGWSNVIVSVKEGRFAEARSWVRDTEADPFVEEPLEIKE